MSGQHAIQGDSKRRFRFGQMTEFLCRDQNRHQVGDCFRRYHIRKVQQCGRHKDDVPRVHKAGNGFFMFWPADQGNTSFDQGIDEVGLLTLTEKDRTLSDALHAGLLRKANDQRPRQVGKGRNA